MKTSQKLNKIKISSLKKHSIKQKEFKIGVFTFGTIRDTISKTASFGDDRFEF